MCRQADDHTERLVKDLFPTHLSPGEYCARFGADSAAVLSYAQYTYRNPALNRWFEAVQKILTEPGLHARVTARWEARQQDASQHERMGDGTD